MSHNLIPWGGEDNALGREGRFVVDSSCHQIVHHWVGKARALTMRPDKCQQVGVIGIRYKERHPPFACALWHRRPLIARYVTPYTTAPMPIDYLGPRSVDLRGDPRRRSGE